MRKDEVAGMIFVWAYEKFKARWGTVLHKKNLEKETQKKFKKNDKYL